MAAVDFFLKIEGIDGESEDREHRGELEILSWSWGVTNTGSAGAGGGGGAGKAVAQDFHFAQSLNKSSPKLFLACATGQHIKKATLTCRKAGAGDKTKDYLVIKMEDVLVSSYQTGGSSGSDALPTDQFSLNFAKIHWTYTAGDGSVTEASFDFGQNRAG
jgi:type VI secretion system secreted protein Hcp